MRSHFLRTKRPILFVSSSLLNQTTTVTSHTPTLPSGWAQRDLLIAFGVDSGVITGTWTSPAGWTEVFDTSGRFVSWKLAASGETNPTFTSSGTTRSNIHMVCYRFATYDVVGTLSAGASPTVAPAITLTENGSSVIAFFSNRATTGMTFTTPTNYTATNNDADGNTPSSAAFRRENLAKGSSGTVSSTPSSGTALGLLIGIKPLT